MSEELVMMNQQLNNPNEAIALFGNQDVHLKRMEEELNVSIVTRGETVNVSGDVKQVEIVDIVIQHLLQVIRKGVSISERDVIYAIQLAKEDKIDSFLELYDEELTKNVKGKSIRVKTLGQRQYVSAIRKKIWYSVSVQREQGKPIWLS